MRSVSIFFNGTSPEPVGAQGLFEKLQPAQVANQKPRLKFDHFFEENASKADTAFIERYGPTKSTVEHIRNGGVEDNPAIALYYVNSEMGDVIIQW